MSSGAFILAAFVVAIVVMIVAIGKYRVHPFLAIMGVSFLLALVALELDKVVDTIGSGFSGAFASIGLVVILGALIGAVLERAGAALTMSDCVVRLVGKKRPELAVAIMGWIVSIPVFCDSGFVVLDPVRKALVKRSQTSSVASTIALSLGLYISHCFIPPTPGPIAASGTLGVENNLLLVMAFGALISLPALAASVVFAKFVGKRTLDASEKKTAQDAVVQTYEELVASYGKLPGAFLSFLPIVLPILLMGAASICAVTKLETPILCFLGKPIVALTVGFLASLPLLRLTGKSSALTELVGDTLKTVGPILFITAAGGVLGKVVGASPLIDYVSEHANALGTIGIFFPFLLAAILKTVQGSSTVAITTTASIVAPMTAQLGLDSTALAALTVVAIGAGAMTVSHANDSYFWVVVNFGELEPTDGYQTQTLGTAIVGVVSILAVFVVSLFF